MSSMLLRVTQTILSALSQRAAISIILGGLETAVPCKLSQFLLSGCE
jgi:hypothetical protein